MGPNRMASTHPQTRPRTRNIGADASLCKERSRAGSTVGETAAQRCLHDEAGLVGASGVGPSEASPSAQADHRTSQAGAAPQPTTLVATAFCLDHRTGVLM